MRPIFLLAILLLTLQACDETRLFEDSRDFSDRSWKMADTARFEFTIVDPGKKYNLYCNVRNSLDYPYARLFVHYALLDSSGHRLSGNLVSRFLFDQRTGQPQGRSGLGDVFDHQFPLLNNFEFHRPGKYSVELQQFMRTDTLSGILAVGIRVEILEKRQ